MGKSGYKWLREVLLKAVHGTQSNGDGMERTESRHAADRYKHNKDHRKRAAVFYQQIADAEIKKPPPAQAGKHIGWRNYLVFLSILTQYRKIKKGERMARLRRHR